MRATIPLTSQEARQRIKESRFRAAPDSVDILLLAGYADPLYGPTRMSRQLHKSLREIADPKEQVSAPANGGRHFAALRLWS